MVHSRTHDIALVRFKRIPPWEWPAETDRTLLAVLTRSDLSEADRLLAAELAGDIVVVNDELALALLAIVQSASESWELRARAAIALGPALEEADTMGFDEAEPDSLEAPISEETFQRIRRSLRELYAEEDVPWQVRLSVLEASVRAPEHWHADAVRAAASRGESLWDVTALFCMRFVPGFEPEILEALRSNHLDILDQAVHAAGAWGIDAAWPRLVEVATSEQTFLHVRLAAIEALSSVRPRESEAVLGELIDSDDEEVASAAWEALETAGELAHDA